MLTVSSLQRIYSVNVAVQGLVWKPLPSLVFGVGATFAALLYVFLPETLGHVLPDTIEEVERMSRRVDTQYE